MPEKMPWGASIFPESISKGVVFKGHIIAIRKQTAFDTLNSRGCSRGDAVFKKQIVISPVGKRFRKPLLSLCLMLLKRSPVRETLDKIGYGTHTKKPYQSPVRLSV